MSQQPHRKHAKLVRPLGGQFHQKEIGFLGAPCGTIQGLTSALANLLSPYRLGYVDADHGSGGAQLPLFRTYTDKITHHQLTYHSDHTPYEMRHAFADADGVLVNTNHYKAHSQVVLINAKKAESLSRKLDRLTNVVCFVLDVGEERVHDFLLAHQPDWAQLPVINISDLNALAEQVLTVLAPSAAVKGLVLAGGKSIRMGQDKAAITYHRQPQREHMAGILTDLGLPTYLSTREETADAPYPQIADTFSGLGPFGGILSAFRSDPNTAWLTVATDQPLLDKAAVEELLKHRDPSRMATCFHNAETGFPEPLITIWEPRAYPRLLQFLAMGYSCPRKTLINSDVHEVQPSRPEVLLNANTPEEKVRLAAMIKG